MTSGDITFTGVLELLNSDDIIDFFYGLGKNMF